MTAANWVPDNNEQRAERDLPQLRRFSETLLNLAHELLSQPVRYRSNDHFAFLCLGFTCAQTEHFEAVCTLVDAGYHKDACLIARAMIEGLCRLLWVAQDPDTRALRWRQFSIVDDFRNVNPEVWRERPEELRKLQEMLSRYGSLFYTSKGQKTRDGKPLPRDPYWRDWTGHTVSQIFHATGGEKLYNRIYKDISCWAHWSPRGITLSLEVKDGKVQYKKYLPEMAATALASGFQSLLETVLLLDSYLGLGFREQLEKLKKDYINTLAGKGS